MAQHRGDPNGRGRLPRHLAVIMDGNGRWAENRGLERARGHLEGVESVREVIKACRELAIPCLTLFAFSLENWRRPQVEIDALMDLLATVLVREVPKLNENDIRLRILGRPDRLPAGIVEKIAAAEAATSANRAMMLNVALSYSARDEIVRAAAALSREILAGRLAPEAIDEAAFAARLDTHGLPDPDLVIRTGGELRLSNYLLWQSAYAELYFTETLWPDFRAAELRRAVEEYAGRERRFGRTGRQVKTDSLPPSEGKTPTDG